MRTAPDRPHGRCGRRGPSALNEFDADIKAWISGGGVTTADLYRLLKSKECCASYDAVRRYANRLLGSSGKPGRRSSATPRPKLAKEVPSARKLSFQFICPKPAKTDESEAKKEPSFLERMRAALPGLNAALQVAGELAAMIRKTLTQSLSDWLAKAAACGFPELMSFAVSLQTDKAAVNEALTGKWSNGPVEGQVNRLKAIKRSMYGRAGLDLLKARVMRK
jgi:transposase